MQHKNKKQKPTKDPFIKYYIVWPIENIIESIADFFKWVWRKLTGAWWCDHCETYHGRRVHMFTYKQSYVEKIANSIAGKSMEDHKMCSLGRDAKWEAESSPLEDLQNAKAKIDADVVRVKRLPENLQQVADDIAVARGDDCNNIRT